MKRVMGGAVTLALLLAGCGSAETPAAQTVSVTQTAVKTTQVPTTVVTTAVRTTTNKVTTTVKTTEAVATGLPADVEAVCNGWSDSMATGIGPVMARYQIGEEITLGEMYEALQAYEAPSTLELHTLKMLKYSARYAALQTAVYLLLTEQAKSSEDLEQADADYVSTAVLTGVGICAETFSDLPKTDG